MVAPASIIEFANLQTTQLQGEGRPHQAAFRSAQANFARAFRIAVPFIVLLVAATALAEDWPTYLRNPGRTGATSEQLQGSLEIRWVYESYAKPQRAYTGPGGRIIESKQLRPRIKFDDALHVAVVGERVYFGSSVDHRLHCKLINSGETVWTFSSGGAIRLAPTVVDGGVYFGSDDGYAYCLNADNGKQIWKLRAGPSDDWFLARQEMISRWPIRTGILVEGGIAYFGAGIFPHENIYLYAVNATDGSIIWKRDNISQQQAGRDDLTPQGYLLATKDLLVVPSGRSLPAAVKRESGEILHKRSHSWRREAGGVVGGTQALLADRQIYTWGAHHILAIDQEKGDVGFGWFDAKQMAVIDEFAYVVTGERIAKLNRLVYAEISRKRHDLDMQIYNLNRQLRGVNEKEKQDEIRTQLQVAEDQNQELASVGILWNKPSKSVSSLIVAGDRVFVGGRNQVTGYDVESGNLVWRFAVDGEARGLVVSNGHLFVSTTLGKIYCFGDATSASVAQSGRAYEAPVANPYPNDKLKTVYQEAARQILERTKIRRGFCLVVGSEYGRLAFELASQSELKIIGVEPDHDKVDASRQALTAAGLYGTRIIIHHQPLSPLPYSNYFANLIVSDRLLLTGELPPDPEGIARHLKPLGGVICLGAPTLTPGALRRQKDWLAACGLDHQSEIETYQTWVTLTLGKLAGAGSWSHQYGEPGNTACSDDRLVSGGLGVLWHGDPGESEMVNRHEGAVGPLATGGRLFIQGQTKIMAYDAYNGLFLWKIDNPDAIRTGVFQNQNPGNLVASDDSLYFMSENKCFRIDAATGQVVASYHLPGASNDDPRQWGYLAYQDGILCGSSTLRTELDAKLRRRGRTTEDSTDEVFAIDTRTGKHLWSYKGQSIEHRTIGLSDDRVFFIDSSITSEQREVLLRQDKAALKKLSGEAAKQAEERMKRLDARLAVALDMLTGKKIWAKPVDVTDCSEIGIGGGKLTLMAHNNVVVLCGANANGHYWKQFIAGEFSRRRLVALSAEDGHQLWAKDANYRHRPIIVEDKIIGEPWKFDLYTGAQEMRANPLTGQMEPWSIMRSGHHCGMLSASPSMLFFRAGYTGSYDLQTDSGTHHFAGHRTGCWINMIPANGLLSIPESSAGCVCLFSINTTVVMEPRKERQPWGIFSSTGAKTPVERMALNLGAPGDRRDRHGTVWLAYPRPRPSRVTSLDLAIDIDPKFVPGGKFTSLNADSLKIAGTENPWVYSSWANGLTKCTLRLLGKDDPPADYRVRLHFADLSNDSSRSPVFDVKMQGRTVIEDLDLVVAAKGTDKALWREVDNVRVTDQLAIELVVGAGSFAASEGPILSGIEVIRGDAVR